MAPRNPTTNLIRLAAMVALAMPLLTGQQCVPDFAPPQGDNQDPTGGNTPTEPLKVDLGNDRSATVGMPWQTTWSTLPPAPR